MACCAIWTECILQTGPISKQEGLSGLSGDKLVPETAANKFALGLRLAGNEAHNSCASPSPSNIMVLATGLFQKEIKDKVVSQPSLSQIVPVMLDVD